jgi:hypothetical protein
MLAKSPLVNQNHHQSTKITISQIKINSNGNKINNSSIKITKNSIEITTTQAKSPSIKSKD